MEIVPFLEVREISGSGGSHILAALCFFVHFLLEGAAGAFDFELKYYPCGLFIG